MLPLRFVSPSPPSGWTGGFHPRAAGHARHTWAGPPLGAAPFVGYAFAGLCRLVLPAFLASYVARNLTASLQLLYLVVGCGRRFHLSLCPHFIKRRLYAGAFTPSGFRPEYAVSGAYDAASGKVRLSWHNALTSTAPKGAGFAFAFYPLSSRPAGGSQRTTKASTLTKL